MSASEAKPRNARYKFQGYNRHGARVWQTIEAATVDDAKQALREQGYRIERIAEAFDWKRSPLVWCAAAFAVVAVAGAYVWAPLIGVGATLLLVMVAAALLENERRQRAETEHQRLKVAVSQSHQTHLRLLAERRKREEVLLDLAVQRIVQQLKTRRQEEEATLIRLDALEDTMPDLKQRSSLRRELEQKRAEIARLEQELRKIEAGVPV